MIWLRWLFRSDDVDDDSAMIWLQWLLWMMIMTMTVRWYDCNDHSWMMMRQWQCGDMITCRQGKPTVGSEALQGPPRIGCACTHLHYVIHNNAMYTFTCILVYLNTCILVYLYITGAAQDRMWMHASALRNIAMLHYLYLYTSILVHYRHRICIT